MSRSLSLREYGPTPAAEYSEADRQPASIFYPKSFARSFIMVGPEQKLRQKPDPDSLLDAEGECGSVWEPAPTDAR